MVQPKLIIFENWSELSPKKTYHEYLLTHQLVLALQEEIEEIMNGRNTDMEARADAINPSHPDDPIVRG